MRFETSAIHAGQQPDQLTGAVIPPLFLSTTFSQSAPGKPVGVYEYSRSDNPTRHAFETCVATLEYNNNNMRKHNNQTEQEQPQEQGRSHHGDNGVSPQSVAFASGLAATVAVVHAVCVKPGANHVVCVDDVYGGTQRYFRQIAAPQQGVQFSFVDLSGDDECAVERRLRDTLRPGETRMVWIETPTNPTMKLIDVRNVVRVVEQVCTGAEKCVVVVDNTFASPFCQRPLELGAAASFSSVSKYINGHSDVIMGVISTTDSGLASRLRFMQNALGAVPSPFDCFLATRGLKTLAVRMRQHSSNASAVVRLLHTRRDKVKLVLYPGDPSHPQHGLCKRQMLAPGGMLSFSLRGGLRHAQAFLAACASSACVTLTLAESLGGVETLIEHPALMTHASVPADVRGQLGIDDTLIRLSVGLENVDDILDDLNHALDAPPNSD